MGIPSVELLEIRVPSAWFLRNNIEKVQNGETARGSVVFAQGAKIAQAVAKYHNSVAQNASDAYNIFGKYAKDSKALDYAGKGINWATKNVNGLIGLSAIYKTATAEDKVETGVNQAGALAGMFVGEGLMKMNKGKVINEKNILNLAEKCKDVRGLKLLSEALLKPGAAGKVASVARGIAFVCASMTSYDLGEKHSKDAAKELSQRLHGNNEEQKQSPQKENNFFTSQKINHMA